VTRPALFLVATALFGACGGVAPPESVPSIVDEGKADDYYSDVADEYEVTGSVGVELDQETYADAELRKDAVTRRLSAVALYLTAYLSQKLFGVDLDGDGQIGPDERVLSDEENLGYGGFQAMVRNETIEETRLEGTPPSAGQRATLRAAFRVVVAGPRDLARRLPRASGPVSATRTRFLLAMPVGATVDPGDVDAQEVRRFDPDKAAAAGVAVEQLELSLQRIPEPGDAFPRYQQFVADGVYDLTLVYGYDPNPKRYDLVEAKKGYEGLLRLGFQPPPGVDSFAALRADSGPFTRRLSAGGRAITVEARLFHSDQWAGPSEGRTARREAQRALILEELRRRDVFFYNGHAGPYEGMTLDPDGIAYVSRNDLTELELDEARAQLFVAQGCQTDAQYADALYATAAKDARNLDVITTVNYAYGEGTMALLENLVRQDGDRHRPQSFYAIIAALNADPINRARDVYYGVIGLGDNGKLHPYADPARLGAACTSSAACGDPDGNWCVRAGQRAPFCAPVTLAASGCPTGTRARQVASGGKIIGSVCVR
jgi:hypothetical protein